MIYIIEGSHGVGKTTQANNYGYGVGHKAFRNVKNVMTTLEQCPENFVFDRFFILNFPNEDLEERREQCLTINNYLKTLDNVKCIMLTCEYEEAWRREQSKGRGMPKEEFDRAYNWYQTMMPLMDAFEIIDTTHRVLE